MQLVKHGAGLTCQELEEGDAQSPDVHLLTCADDAGCWNEASGYSLHRRKAHHLLGNRESFLLPWL